jgi:uncharacterized protein with PIN domain
MQVGTQKSKPDTLLQKLISHLQVILCAVTRQVAATGAIAIRRYGRAGTIEKYAGSSVLAALNDSE